MQLERRTNYVQKESERPAYEALALFAIRLPEFRKRALRLIDPGDIPYSDIFSVWLTLREIEKNGAPVDENLLRASVQPRLVDGVPMPDDLISRAFDPQLQAVPDRQLEQAANLVLEQIVDDIVARKLRRLTPSGFRPANLMGELEKIYRFGVRLHGLNLESVLETFDGPIPDLSQKFYSLSTGISFLDFYMGGLARGEVYGVIGPTGGGKTTLGVQLATSLIKCGVGPVFYVYFEPDSEFVRLRAISCAGFVSMNSLIQNCLSSDPDQLKDYERDMQREIDPKQRVPELDRASYANRLLNHRLFLVSAMASPSYESVADPAVLEQLIARKCSELGQTPAAVVVDWLGIQAEILCEIRGGRQPLRYYINRTINDYLRVAENLGTSVWIFHQLTGKNLDQKPGLLVTHSNALESKAFANMMSFCFGLGTSDRETHCVTFNCSKSRRAAPKPHRILRFDPWGISRLIDVSDRFTIDPVSKTIVPIEESGSVIF